MAETRPNGGTLPPNPSLEFLRKSAKQRLKALRVDKPDAKLAEAQLLVAREHGFASWRAMAAAVLAADPAAAAEHRQKLFRNAVIDGDLAAAERLLTADPSLANALIFSFDSPAVNHVRGNLARLDLLLAHGADINRKSQWWAGGFGVLDTADRAFAQAVIARGATVDVFAAMQLDDLDRVRSMLRADPSLVHARGGDGGRPLHFARSVEAVDLLLDAGAEIDARDVDHESTAAQWLLPRAPAESPHDGGRALPLVQRLVECGAATDVFMLAALGDVARLSSLLDADPAALDAKVGNANYPPCPDGPSRHIYLYTLNEGRTPFEIARAFGRQDCLALLLARSTPRQQFLAACAAGDAEAARAVGRSTPSMVAEVVSTSVDALPNAAWTGNAAAVRLMLDFGFDPGTIPAAPSNALHCAAWHGRAEIVKLLLDHASVRPRLPELLAAKDTRYGSTPLGWCCHGSTQCRNPAGDYPAVAKLLLDAGAEIGPNLADASPAVRAVLGRKNETGRAS